MFLMAALLLVSCGANNQKAVEAEADSEVALVDSTEVVEAPADTLAVEAAE